MVLFFTAPNPLLVSPLGVVDNSSEMGQRKTQRGPVKMTESWTIIIVGGKRRESVKQDVHVAK